MKCFRLIYPDKDRMFPFSYWKDIECWNSWYAYSKSLDPTLSWIAYGHAFRNFLPTAHRENPSVIMEPDRSRDHLISRL